MADLSLPTPASERAHGPAFEPALCTWQRLCLMAIVVITTFAFLHSPGTPDVSVFWLPWMEQVRHDGLVRGFSENQGDYPPLASVYLLAAARVGEVFGLTDLEALKLSLAVFLLATSALFWLWTRSLLLTTFLHLSLVLNSVALGYLDVYVTLPLLGALWALREARHTTFALLFAAACLSKWHPLIIAPFFLVYVLQKAGPKVTAMRVVVPGVLIVACPLAVFQGSLVASLTKALTHPYLSAQALNLHWIITHALHGLAPDHWGALADGQSTVVEVAQKSGLMVGAKCLFWAVYASVLFLLWWSKNSFENLIFYTLLGFLSYFTLNTGVHENHLLLASVLATVLCFLEGGHVVTMVVIALLNNLNLFFFYGVNGKGPDFSRVALVDLTVPTAVCTVVNFLVLYRSGVARIEPATGIRGLAARTLPRAVPLLATLFLPLGVLLGFLPGQAAASKPLFRPAPDGLTVEGSFDGAGAEDLTGWAWDSTHPDNPIAVDIYDGDTLLDTVPANEFRPDLAEAKKGNGAHAFTYPTPQRLLDGKEHVLKVLATGTDIEIGSQTLRSP